MHPRTYREFERICSTRRIEGSVLEIGAVPSDNSLLCMNALAEASERIGLNLEGPSRYRDFEIVSGNANDLPFPNDRFDAVLCNAVLEHDPFFWRSIDEIRRVTRPGGLVVIGTPSYTQFPNGPSARRVKDLLVRVLWKLGLRDRVVWLLKSTPTIEIHDAPGDYYRFSPQAFREVLFAGMRDVEVKTILFPPVVIGAGIVPGERP